MGQQGATIVTGGGRGIGRAIAIRMARETPVLIVGRTASDLASTCAYIQQEGGKAACCVGDIADPTTAERAVTLVHEHDWTVRHLVCNAGIGKGGASATFDRHTWREMFEINVHGSFWFIQVCLPEMQETQHGTICLISSIAGLKGYKYQAAYCATKHALVGLARSLALEHAKHGIVVVPICPAFVASDMTQHTVAGLVKYRGISEAEAENLIAATNPQHRIIPPEEVAEMVAMVCAGQLPSLNGNPLILSGGE